MFFNKNLIVGERYYSGTCILRIDKIIRKNDLFYIEEMDILS